VLSFTQAIFISLTVTYNQHYCKFFSSNTCFDTFTPKSYLSDLFQLFNARLILLHSLWYLYNSMIIKLILSPEGGTEKSLGSDTEAFLFGVNWCAGTLT